MSCHIQRVYDRRACWLLTLCIGHEHGFGGGGHVSGFPQSWAVVDDFGTLVAVSEQWR